MHLGQKEVRMVFYAKFCIEPTITAKQYYHIHRYLKKGLGELVCESPFTVRLKFEPADRAVGEDGQYREVKVNRCVVCGASHSYQHKTVVPREYSKYFPSRYHCLYIINCISFLKTRMDFYCIHPNSSLKLFNFHSLSEAVGWMTPCYGGGDTIFTGT